MAHNYDGITAASYMDDPDVRAYLDKFFRDHHPDVTDETMIKAIVDRQFHQYPFILMLAECEKRLDAANKAIETAQDRNTSQDASTATEVKALKTNLTKAEKKLTAAEEDAERYKKQRDGFENQYLAMMKSQKSGGQQ
jgi:predicted  nucleic acid-binding Zn-ribbon protein